MGGRKIIEWREISKRFMLVSVFIIFASGALFTLSLTLKEKLLNGLNRSNKRGNKPSVGRYAPSPSGHLHLGNIQTALLAWLQIRLRGGKLILRIDDLDSHRTKPTAVAQIMTDLRWLGFDWDGVPYYQSANISAYQAAFAQLQSKQQIYPCRCSRADILGLASAPHARGDRIIYPGTCRTRALLSDENSDDGGSGSAAEVLAWRFKVDAEPIVLTDNIAGSYRQNLATQVGDFVVKRKDGVFAYQLATVVDDGLLGVSDVLRGADLLDSTPRQIALSRALGLPPIADFWHAPLKLDANGERLAKRNMTNCNMTNRNMTNRNMTKHNLAEGELAKDNSNNSLTVLREQGLTPEQVIGKLSFELNLLGENKPISLAGLKQALLTS